MTTTRYVICTSPTGWNDPAALHIARPLTGVRHRTIEAACRAEDAIQRRCKATNGPNTFLQTRILAEREGRDGPYSHLTEREWVQWLEMSPV